jgi:hypothetical protein
MRLSSFSLEATATETKVRATPWSSERSRVAQAVRFPLRHGIANVNVFIGRFSYEASSSS